MLRYWGPRKHLSFIALALILAAPVSLYAQEEGEAAPEAERCASGYAYHAAKRECVECNQPCRTGRPGICGRGIWNCEVQPPSCEAAVKPGERLEICNGEDDDCDGRIDEGYDKDSDRYTTCRGDCDDRDPKIHPDAVERCDGVDNNCNGLIDDGFNVGGYCTAGLGKCQREGKLVCSESGLAAVCDAAAGAPSAEVCDGVDNDCDGEIDEGLGDLTCGKGECAKSVPACLDGKSNECVAGEPGDELCGDGLDNDCDGRADEGFEGLGRTCYDGVGACRKSGRLECSEDKLSLTCSAVASEPKAEICGNRIDDDCDGEIDSDAPGLGEVCTNEQRGVCSREGKLACDAAKGVLYCTAPNVEPSGEVCDDLDNDCDGEIDEGVRNACDGCGELPGVIGEICSVEGGDECAKGRWTCDAKSPRQAVCLRDDGITEGSECASDDNICTIDRCVKGACRHEAVANGIACDDGDACTISDVCVDGACLGGSMMACDDGNPCTEDSCESSSGCSHKAIGQGRANECGGCESLPASPGSQCTLAERHGPCTMGTYVCQPDGAMLCVQSTFARDEECNGADDDCDGEVDEGLGTTKCGIGACEVEIAFCQGGRVAECVPGDPSPEACDNMGVDDDCNGIVDDVARLGESCPVAVGSCVVPGEQRCVGDAQSPICVPKEASDAEDSDGDGVANYCEGDARPAMGDGGAASGDEAFSAADTRASIIPWREVFDSAVMNAGSPDRSMLLMSGATGEKGGFAVLRAKDVGADGPFSFTQCEASVGERPMLIAAGDRTGSVLASEAKGYLRYHKITSQIPSPEARAPECKLYGERIALPQRREFKHAGSDSACAVESVGSIAILKERPLTFAGAVDCRAEGGSKLKRGSAVLGLDVVEASSTGDPQHEFVPVAVDVGRIERSFVVPLGSASKRSLLVVADAKSGNLVTVCVHGDVGWRCTAGDSEVLKAEPVFAAPVGNPKSGGWALIVNSRGEAYYARVNSEGEVVVSEAGRAAGSTGGKVSSAVLMPKEGGTRYLAVGAERSISMAAVTRGGDGAISVRPAGAERAEPRAEHDDISPGGRFSFGRPHAMATLALKRFGGSDLFAAYDMRKAGRPVGTMGFLYWNANEAPTGRVSDLSFDGAKGRARLAFSDPTGDRLRFKAWIKAAHGGSLDHWVDGFEGGWLRFSVKRDAGAVGLWPVEIVVEASDPAGSAVRSKAVMARDGSVESITEIPVGSDQ